MTWIYIPIIKMVLDAPKTTFFLTGIVLVIGLWPATQIGSEFMPPLDEGDLMYMPTTYPGISIGKARELLQQTDKLIKTLPEVKSVFGKIGRAETATDPAPLTMIETLIQLKPKSEWREGVPTDSLRRELDQLVKFPGLTNAWVMPIKTRIDMLATGIKTPVGIKVSGPDLKEIEKVGKRLEQVLKNIQGTASVYSERVAGGRYIKADIDRDKAARYGLNIADVQQVIMTAIGGMQISQSVEGLERYPINVRYPQTYRDSVEKIRLLPLVTKNNQRIALADVADINVVDGPPAIKSENARLNGWTLVDIDGRDLGSYVAEAQRVVAEQVKLPAGYAIAWSGQYEYMIRAKERLTIVVPLTLGIIVLLLYINFRNIIEVMIIMGTLPFALIGGFWLIYLLKYDMPVAVGVGFIDLAGATVEIGVLMLVYLNQAYAQLSHKAQQENRCLSTDDVKHAVLEGAGKRVRPIMMTVAAIVTGLIPIMFGEGTGSEVMQRIAGPMIGGMLSSLVLTLLVIPAVYYLWKSVTLDKCRTHKNNKGKQ